MKKEYTEFRDFQKNISENYSTVDNYIAAKRAEYKTWPWWKKIFCSTPWA